MTYQSVDVLQKALSSTVFKDRTDTKKAAGRALGTILELITFYLFKHWELNEGLCIERRIPEYNNPDITHNVEFTLHPIVDCQTFASQQYTLPLSTSRILISHGSKLPKELRDNLKTTQVLSSKGLLRNSAVIGETSDHIFVANLAVNDDLHIATLEKSCYAMIECKRVGVEEGQNKGPTTIEKAKQGAYVARTVSRLQRFRGVDGEIFGVYPKSNGEFEIRPYLEELERIVNAYDPNFVDDVVVSIGVVSNHGNWYTDAALNKELNVLAGSYDWLLFLSDEGLSSFIEELILSPNPERSIIADVFSQSYDKTNGGNSFTKVKIDRRADAQILEYFSSEYERIARWFTVITPADRGVDDLRVMLKMLEKQRRRASNVV